MLRDDDAVQIFIEESEEHLADIEKRILALEQGNSEIDDDLVNKIFRAVHTVKGGAGFLGYENIKNLAHKIENILGLIREHQLVPTPSIISVLLKAADFLQVMIHNLDTSNTFDISCHLDALTSIIKNGPDTVKKGSQGTIQEKSARLAAETISERPADYLAAQQTEMARDQEAVDIFIQESEEHLAEMEENILALEQDNSEFDEGLVNKIFRAVHTIKGGAGFLGYENIKKLAHTMEHLMSMIRERQRDPTPPIISVLLKSTDSLQGMIHNPDTGNKLNIADQLLALKSVIDSGADHRDNPIKPVVQEKAVPPTPPTPTDDGIPQEDARAHSSPHSPTLSAETTNLPEEGALYIEKSSKNNSLRVNVHLLDQLMNLAGEMVLCRNQLVQAVASKNMESIEQVKQRIDITTSELQESVMFTRMQPIGNVFKRFPRLTRELSLDLGKEVDLSIEGEDVEVDKTIIEAISAPLTHLIRNAIDHGIEMPEGRRLANKDKKGKVILRAGHEAGMVILEVIDDGRGISTENITASLLKKGLLTEDQVQHLSDKEKLHLIFLPGFTTAESVSDISGRGVGMDVVKTNLDKLGGQIEISSKPGKGTAIRIKLPLTLAIISAQIIICGQQRYSIPQVNLEELLRVQPHEIKDRIEVVGKAPVLKLRGKLLPLVKLVDVLGGTNEYVEERTGTSRQDRRKNVADRRSLRTAIGLKTEQGDIDEKRTGKEVFRTSQERRRRKSGTLYIAIVNTGTLKYGLVVDALKEAEEIVVKPLGRHLKSSKKYSGATIMGDGCVSLILDVANIAREAGLISFENSERAMQLNSELENSARHLEDVQSFLLFRNGGPDQFAVPLNLVLRVIQIESSEIEYTIGNRVLQYRGESLPLFSIDEVVNTPPFGDREDLLVILFQVTGRQVGLLATQPVNSREIALTIDNKPHHQPGIMGSVIIDKKTTLLVNIHEVVKILNPHWFSSQNDMMPTKKRHIILIAEDSAFFQAQIAKTLEEEGFNTIIAEDGQAAWEKLEDNAQSISLLVTDIEMPRLNGFKLTEKIRENARFTNLPVIALTTLAGDDDQRRGKEAGVNEYLVKFDRDLLIENVYKLLAIQ